MNVTPYLSEEVVLFTDVAKTELVNGMSVRPPITRWQQCLSGILTHVILAYHQHHPRYVGYN